MHAVTTGQETLRIVQDHMLVDRAGRTVLLDTGVPDTMPCPEVVSEVLGTPVHSLIGCSELARSPLRIDWSAGTLTHGSLPDRGAIAVPLGRAFLGIPTIRVGTAGSSVTAVLDTGAALSYVSTDAVDGLRSIRTVQDFLPGLGEFETEVYRVDIIVGGVPLTIEAGVLPPLLQMALSMMCPDGWIIGAALFRDRVVTLDLAGSVLHLAPETTPAPLA